MDSAGRGQEDKVHVAKHVYLLMKKEYRISRNIRALWYLQHLNHVLHYRPRQTLEDVTEELTVLSVLPCDETVSVELGKEYRFLITPDTIITFISRRYRLVFALDLSPSSASVDLCSGEVLFDEVLTRLQNCLLGLVQPLTLPGSFLVLNPQIYVTVIASTPLLTCSTNHVITQGMLITRDNIHVFIREARSKLMQFEATLVQNFSKVLRSEDYMSDGIGLTGGLFVDIVEPTSSPVPPDILVSPEPCFVNMLKYGILALQLLPENTSAGIIVITDGMVGLPNASVFETLMIQLRNGTIACSFLRLGSSRNDSCQLGHVPHVELLQFIATATFGAYFSTCPVLTECEPSMNVYHQAFFCWNFQKGLDGFKIEDLSCKNPGELTEDLAWENSPCVPPSRQGLKWQNLSPVVRKKHGETTLHTSISSVMSLRLREGYTIKEIQVTKGESQLMVTLVLPWRDFVRIEYVASTNWPLDDTNLVTHTEIVLEGSYEFLHDVTCPHKQPLRSVYRTAVVKKFWQTLQGIQQTDQLLVHLQSFSSNLDYYNIPDSIKNGVPLFFVQSSSSMPCLSLQHSSKDTALSQFAAFWKPVFNLDTNIWQKWMHTHRIGIILEHDTPLPKYLHIPNSSRRFNSIQCRQALSSLNGMLRDWSSFVLVENLSYINLLQPDPDKPPTSFCLLRVSSKPPCMVLRLAFLGGTPGAERHEFTRDLRDRVRALKFPQRGTQKADKPRRKEVQSELSESTERAELTKIRRKPPLLREWAEIHCCVLVTKPVEKILIRYERIPREMMNIDDPGHDAQGMSPHHAPPNPLASIFTVLSRYLYHKRWVWSVQHSSSTPLSMTAINKILSTLSKIRLQEGFHFAMSNIGIVTMVLEVDMMRAGRDNIVGAENADELGSCIIQYVIFPPYTKTTRGSVSEDDLDEMETTEADGELQIVTECWVEPQSGVVLNSTPERLYMEGLNYRQIPQQFYPLDLECISCLITFQHLVTVCQCFNLTAPDSQLPIYASTLPESLSTGRPHRPTDKDCEDNEPPVKHTPFPFDLLTLLPRCQQAELLFSTYWSGDDLGNQQSVNNLLFDLLYQKFKLHHDKEVILSPNDCLNFVRLVTERKRDVEAQPYPFRFADLLAAAPENVVIESVVIRDEEGAPDCGPSEASSVSDARDGEKESCASSKDRSTVGPDKTESSAGLAGVLGTPNWNCLVKVDTTNHLILTFLPATYDDLALLNLLCLDGKGPQSSATESHKERPHVVEETGAPSSVAKEDGDTEELSPLPVDAVSDDARDGSTGDDLHSEFSLSSGKNPTSPLTKQQPSTKIRIEQSPGENVPQVPKFPIPVYVYDCYLSNLSNSLVDRWNFELSEDIFEDLTFPSDMDISGAVPLSPRVRMASHEMETMPDFEREENTDTVKDRWRQSLDRRSTDSVSDFHGALWQHCVVLGEDYFTSYVTGIFKNLQVGHSVSKEDVESAINSICEEALPLEADMTCFLETSCGHLLQQIERSKVEGIAPADNLDSGDGKAVVRFADIPGDVEGTGIMEESGETSRSTTVPEVLLFPTGSSINIHIADLHLSTPCESPKGLHELIKTKFSDIVKLWFKPIPSYPDYYFYSPENGMDISTHQDFSDTAGAESDFQPAEMGGIPEEYSDYFMSDYEEAGPMEKAPSIRSEGEFSTMSNKGSVSPAPSGSSAVEDDLDSFNEVENARNQPLFLHFTCTLKSKTFHHNVSLQLLPTCLVDLTKYLEGLTDIDLGDMKVTFDLNCLTLPTDADYSSLSRRPKYVRMSSHTSASPPQSDVEGEDAVSTTTSHDAFQFRGIDPISHLPKFQKRAVENCKKEIEWLLRDELTSSLRHIYPVTVANLQLVADHVKASPGKPTCLTESIPIKFVFGQEHSLPKFIQELERLNLKGYRIMKEDQYYFIVVDRARPRNWAHAYELNSKLVELSRECSPAKEVHRFSTESDTAPPINEKLDKEPEANQIVSSPDAVFLADDVSAEKGDDPHDHLSRCLTAIGFTPVASGSRSSESPEVRRSEPSPKSVALLFDSVEKIDKNSLQGSDQQIPTTIKSSMSMVNVQPRTSYPTVTAPSPEENVVLKRSSSFSGFTMEEQFTPLTTTPEKSAQGTDPSNSVLKSVASAPHMVLHNRVKHFSGPSGTTTTPLSRTSTRPQTPSWVSSTGSYTEGGYEGGSSDPEDDDEVRSHTGVTVHSPLYITFWLLIQVHQDKVDVFYHTRDTKSADDQEAVYQKEILDRVLELIKSYCRIVNQHMLMLDLYETRMCNPLLVPEADEDVTWRRDSVTKHKQLPAGADLDDEDEDGTQGQVCLMDNLKLKPGFFACDPVLKHHFLLHPRIKTGPSRSSGISRGVQVLRARLNTFSVNNRKNMFVIRESTTENVFYLRLQDMEMCDGSFTEGGAGSCKDNEDAVSASSSLRSMNRRGTDVSLVNKTNPDGEDSETTSGEKEADALSVGSSGIMRLDSRHEECIELSVHGITTPGPEIRDLIQILQKRLDDAVLDIIALMLFRNPMCKLTADDVHFIQQPDQEPSRELLLTVPSSASLQLFALMYYLRQNLKQFLTVPNYTDTRGDNHFQDQAGGQGTAIPEGSCFLYNTPQGAGSKGIACVSLSLVDGQKNLKRLVGCCKPSRSAYREWMDIADMQRQITTEEYTPGEATWPGPQALIRFRMWARGTVHLDTLTRKLREAVTHALCDIVMEYRLLTTPICEPPNEQTLEEELRAILLSEPLSPPRAVLEGKEKERRLSGVKGMEQSRSPGKSAGPASPFQTIFSDFRKRTRSPSAKESPKTFDFSAGVAVPKPTVAGDSSTQEAQELSQPDADIRALAQRYEAGERGQLQAKYWSNIIQWLDFCSANGCPSVQKSESSVLSRFSVDMVLRELQNSVKQVTSDAKPVVYRLTECAAGVTSPVGVPHNVNRQPVVPSDPSNESSTDLSGGQLTCLSQSNNYLMIGRNFEQWQSSLEMDTVEEPAEYGPSGSGGGPKKYVKFQPYDISQGLEKLPVEVDINPESTETFFVPRQRLLIVTVREKQFCMYTYNWTGDLTSTLTRLFSRLVQWHGARSHLLNNLLHQKMGLFHHHTLTEPPQAQSSNCFIQQNMEIELLIQSTTPPSREPQRRQTNSMQPGSSGSGAFVRHFRPFEKSFYGLRPPKPLHRSSYGNNRDPVTRHGMQTKDIKYHERKDTERAVKLQKLYHEWHGRPGSTIPIAEDYLVLLKQSARLVHYCATPLLLSPRWRHKAMARPDMERPHSVPVTSSTVDKIDTKSRSRHSSGASNTSLKNRRTDSQEDKRKSAPTPTSEAPDFRPRGEVIEEAWHIELRRSFLSQYIQYLQSLGFMQVQTRPNSPRRGGSRSTAKRSEDKVEEEERGKKRSMLTCLQKTLPGGILLMELNYRDVYFCVKLFAHDCMQLPLGVTVNSQLRLLFVDECDKYRDLIHVHSFAHDFHLRCIQSYIQGRQYEFKQGYHLAGFLSDFYQIHPSPPSFARNYLSESTLSFHNINTSGEQLYSYMVEHAKLYDMKALKMMISASDLEPDYEVVRETEQALVCQNFDRIVEDADLRHQLEDFDVGLAIVAEGHTMLQELEQLVDRSTLRLRYYIIMTSRRDLFPKSHLGRRLSLFKSAAAKQQASEKTFVIVSGSPLPYSESMTDLSGLSSGSDAAHTLPIRPHYLVQADPETQPVIALLQKEVAAAKAKIKGMVESSITLCRRDVLWQRLILGGEGVEEESRRKKRSDTEDSKTIYKLTFSEFSELLGMVTKWPLRNLDDRLLAMESMSLPWYHSLAQLLVAKNPQNHRQFVSPDGAVQYVVLINPWQNPPKLENFMLLHVDNQGHRAELCAVFQEVVLDNDHSAHILGLPSVQTYVESFVSTCCFHLWSSMLAM